MNSHRTYRPRRFVPAAWPARGLAQRMFVAVALGAVLAAAGPWARASLAAPLPQATTPRFDQAPCLFALPDGAVDGQDVRCGWLTVREEHADAGSPTLRLAVAVILASGPRPLPDPLVFSPGGPGDGAVDDLAALLIASPLRSQRDLIVYDRRGTGRSEPSLDCPEVREANFTILNQGLRVADAGPLYNGAALKCRERLVQAGLNLSAYNTLESATDLEDLRQALGYGQLDLYGGGYGSRVVLAALRGYPLGVRSAVLDGVQPPGANAAMDAPSTANRAFTEFFQACAADNQCRVAYRNLDQTFYDLVNGLNTFSARIHITDSATGQTYQAQFSGDNLVWTLAQAMQFTDLIPLLPELIRNTAAERYGLLEAVVANFTFDRGWSAGAYWSAYCADTGPFDPETLNVDGLPPELGRGQLARARSAASLCQAWRVRALGPDAQAPVTSDVPALVMNGRFDPVTPPAAGGLVAATLSHSTAVTFTTVGRSAFPWGGDCATRLMTAFLNEPAGVPDTRCVVAAKMDFLTPSEVLVVPVRDLALAVRQRQTSTVAGLAGLAAAGLILLSGLLVFPVAWLAGLRGKPAADLAGAMPAGMPAEIPTKLPAMPTAPPDPSQAAAMLPKLASWLSILTGLVLAAFAGLVVIIVQPLVASQEPITWLGLPASLWWVLAPAVVLAVLTLVLVAATALGWMGTDWSWRRRFYQALLMLAAIAAFVLLAMAGTYAPLVAYGRGLLSGVLPGVAGN